MANNRQEKDQNNTQDRGPGKPGSLNPQHPTFDAQEDGEGIEAVPFSLDEVALMGGPAAGAQKGPTGQFSGDDLEFESFMFDQGDRQQSAQGNAAAPPAPAPLAAPAPASNTAPAAPAVPPGLPRISGDTVSTPFLPPLPSDGAPGAQVGASPMQAQSPAQSGPLPRDGAAPPVPPASSLDAARTLDPNTGNLAGTGGQPSTPLSGPLNGWLTSGPLSEQAVPAPASPSPSAPAQPMPTSPNLAKTQLSGPLSQRLSSSPLSPQMVQPASYPTSVAGWNDELLASVKDFSAVLLALRAGAAQTQAATDIPMAPVVPSVIPSTEAVATGVSGEQESAPHLPHLIGDASSGHTGWTSVQLNDEALASRATAEDSGPQAEMTPEQVAGDQPESAAALEGNLHEGGEGLSWLGSLTSSGPLLTSSGPLRSDQVSATPPSEEPVMEAAAQAERTEMEAPTPTLVPIPVAEQPEAQAAAPASEPLERGEQPDSGLPPWLMEEPEDTDMAASRASLPSQAAEPEVSSLVGLGTTDTAGTQTLTPNPSPLTPTGEATGQGMPLLGAQAGMDAAATGATSSTFADLPDLPEGGLSGDDLEFENFMFDEGKSVPLPSLPNIGEFMSSVQSMEATIGPASLTTGPESWVPGQAKLDSEPSIAPAMEPAFEAEDEDESLPFWLQDSNAENVEAAPPDSLMPTSGYLEVAAEPAPDQFTPDLETYFTGAGEFAQFAQVEVEPESEPALMQVQEYESPGADLGYAASEQGGDFTELPPIEPFDFETELPPIEPFDFSMVQPPPQQESLGFNTEELTGAQLSAYEPLMVTANLDELAKLLGKDPANLRGQESEAAKLLLGQILETPHKQAEPVATPDEQAQLRSEGGEQRPAAWTVMETSKLQVDAVNDLTGAISEAAMPTGAMPTGAMPTEQDLSRGFTSTPTPMSSTEELTMADLDVAPFDITELNLDADELGTGLLHLDQVETGLLRSDADFPPGTIPEAPYARPHERVFTNTLFSRPGGQPQSSAPADPPNRWEAPKWMGSDRPSPASDRGAGQLAGRSPSPEPRPGGDPVSPERSQTRDLETTRFASSSAPPHTEPEPASVDDPDNIFKVRVSKFKSVRSGPLGGLEAGDAAPLRSSPQPTAPGPEMPAPASQPATRGPAPLAAQDTQSGPISATGPLPAVQGFEHLESMAKEKPDDLGSRMALAVAYAQAGYMEHAMHEYGRLLKNRHVPAPMLQLVSDLLSDVEDEATGSVRFHQTRGDLYMKQGRHQEAIEEYNKIK